MVMSKDRDNWDNLPVRSLLTTNTKKKKYNDNNNDNDDDDDDDDDDDGKNGTIERAKCKPFVWI